MTLDLPEADGRFVAIGLAMGAMFGAGLGVVAGFGLIFALAMSIALAASVGLAAYGFTRTRPAQSKSTDPRSTNTEGASPL